MLMLMLMLLLRPVAPLSLSLGLLLRLLRLVRLDLCRVRLLLLLLVVVGRVALKVRVVLRVVRDEDHVLVEDLLLLVERELLEGVELVDEDLPLLVDDEVLWLGLLVLALVLALILCGVAVREVRGVVDKRGGGGRVSLLLRQQLLRLLRLLLLLLLLLCRRRRRLLLLGHGFPCFLPSFVASCLLSMIVLDLAPRAWAQRCGQAGANGGNSRGGQGDRRGADEDETKRTRLTGEEEWRKKRGGG